MGTSRTWVFVTIYIAMTKKTRRNNKGTLTEYKISQVLKSRNDITLKKENTHLRKKNSYRQFLGTVEGPRCLISH